MIKNYVVQSHARQRLRRVLHSSAAVGSLLLLVGPALAQAAAPEKKAGGIEEVVVTARRSTEKLSKVPVSVAVLGAKALQERHIVTETDLEAATPGLTVYGTSSSNSLNFSLRGQSVDAYSFAAPAVLTYVNEFSVQSDSASSFYDLDNIQVLKGPQGTLFGRNATGGAVLYQTKRPTDVFGGYFKTGFGNYADITTEGAVNLPLPNNMGALRLSGDTEKRNGYQNNLLLGGHDGSLDNLSGRASLLLTPTPDIESLTVFQYSFNGGVSVGIKAVNAYLPGEMNGSTLLAPAIPSAAVYTPGFVSTLPSVAKFGFNGLLDFLKKQQNYGFYDIFNTQTNNHEATDILATNNTSYHISDALTIKNVIGYHSSRSADKSDVEGSPYQPLTIGVVDGPAAGGYHYFDKQFSEELQASGKLFDERLSYIIGAYYFHGDERQTLALDILGDIENPVTGSPVPPAAVFTHDYLITSDSEAAYAQATYKLTSRINLTGGVRITNEKISYTPANTDFEYLIGVRPASQSAAKPSWTVSLDYKLTDEWLLYAANRGSWRSGGFNGTAQTTLADGHNIAQSFKPETTYDFEIGAKYYGHVGSMPASFDVALYDQTISNVIRAIYFNAAANSGNVKQAEVRGVEADGSIKPMPWLQLGFSTALTDAEYTNPVASIDNQSFTFGPYADTPKFTGSVYGQVSSGFKDGSDGAIRVDYYMQSKFFYSNLASTILPNTEIPPYGLLNMRLEWNHIHGSAFSADVYGKNLADRQYYVGGFATGALFGLNSVLEGQPRMYGFELSASF